ncbi:unnamed protein product [Mytilus edulis]|uniref:Uncharacterized protein n=1 Tax=Mytilus edulis TaxID=6550 RepID=A0A8S3U7A5_MYTED|nr:unnamed protein product [Mytilus edulis]
MVSIREEYSKLCEWYVINHFIRPTSYAIENGQIGTATNDCWLIQRLIKILIKSESSQHGVDISSCNIEKYIKKYGCEQFVNSFNTKLAEWFQSEQNVANCEWDIINYFIRPKSFTIDKGQIATVTHDDWLIKKLIKSLMKSESSKHRVGISAGTIERYIKSMDVNSLSTVLMKNLQNGFNWRRV